MLILPDPVRPYSPVAEQASKILAFAIKKACWHVSVGGCTLPTFSLAIGERIKRERPLENAAQPIVFRENSSEISLLVWCAWRLDSNDAVIVSHDCQEDEIVAGLEGISGKLIEQIEMAPPAWDLVLQFEGPIRLNIFCNHSGRSPTFERNWQARIDSYRVNAGPGSHLNVERREIQSS